MSDEELRHIAPGLRGLAVPLERLSVDPSNVRAHSPRNLEAIKASLRRFGQQKPVVTDPAGVVIAGNGTLEAARQLGWKHIAAVASGLAGADRAAFAIADNRTAELAEWDTSALARQLESLGAEEDFDVQVTGFSDQEIQRMIDGVSAGAEGDRPPSLKECFQIVVECDCEDHQRALYERLCGEGLKCRLLVL